MSHKTGEDTLESSDELQGHLKDLLSKIKPNSLRHEEIDLDIEGDEII